MVVALICMVGVLPYIAPTERYRPRVNLLIGSGADSTGTRAQDTALIVSLVLALFTIVFGTRSLDVTEHHRGMVLAIAFESLVKLTAFLAVGIFVTFGLLRRLRRSSSPRPAPRRSWPTTGKRPCTGRRCCCRPAWR